MQSKIRIGLLCAMAMLLSNCSFIGAGTDSFCQVGRPIYISRSDVLTDLTARQILDHNAGGKELCKWGK